MQSSKETCFLHFIYYGYPHAFGHPVIGCTAAKFRSFLTLLTDLETTDAGAIVYEMTDDLVLSSI